MADKSDRKRITIADVARAAGLSPTTVSHSLNDIGQVDPKTRQRIKDIAHRLNYRPSIRAQRLRTGRSHAIALLSSMPSAISAGESRLGFFTELAMGSAQAALLRGYVLVLAPPLDRLNPLEFLDIDGAILLEPAPIDPIARGLDDRSIPYVTIGHKRGKANIDLFHEEAADLLLGHLRECGARTLGIVLGTNGRESQRMFRKRYLALVRQSGQGPLIVEAAEEEGEEAGYRAALALLAAHPEIDGLCAPIDAFASGALRAASEIGRTVGRDLLLATRHDGLRARSSTPALTAVDLHLEAVSMSAVDLLLRRLGDVAPDSNIAAPRPPTLVARASTRKR